MMNVDGAAFFFLYDFSGHSGTLDSLLVFLSIYLPIILGVAAIFYIALTAYPRREKEVAFISGLLSLALSRILIGETLRFLLPRERPMHAMNLHALFPEDSSSFPSGHALALFAVGGMLYAYNKKVGVLFNVLALAVCFARVASGVHYPSDILAGALIGFGSAWLVWKLATPYIRTRLQTLTQ